MTPAGNQNMNVSRFVSVHAAKGIAPSAPQGFRQVHTRRTFEEVAAQVREMMFDGSLRPGDRLPPERELAILLGVGRPALREALRALEVGGLIELRKGKSGGAFISSGNQRVVSSGMSDMLRLRSVPISELFEAREWIMSSLVRSACLRVTPEEVQALRENIDRAEQLHAQGRFDERIHANFEFYSLLARATRNSVAEMIMRGLSDSLRSLIHQVGSDLAPNFFTLRRSLLQAIEAHDDAAAAKRMVEIVRSTEETYKRLAQARRSASGAELLVASAADRAPAKAAKVAKAKSPAKSPVRKPSAQNKPATKAVAKKAVAKKAGVRK